MINYGSSLQHHHHSLDEPRSYIDKYRLKGKREHCPAAPMQKRKKAFAARGTVVTGLTRNLSVTTLNCMSRSIDCAALIWQGSVVNMGPQPTTTKRPLIEGCDINEQSRKHRDRHRNAITTLHHCLHHRQKVCNKDNNNKDPAINKTSWGLICSRAGGGTRGTGRVASDDLLTELSEWPGEEVPK